MPRGNANTILQIRFVAISHISRSSLAKIKSRANLAGFETRKRYIPIQNIKSRNVLGVSDLQMSISAKCDLVLERSLFFFSFARDPTK